MIREVKEGRLRQGASEQICYQLLTIPWGGNPISPQVFIYQLKDDGLLEDVSSTCLLGEPKIVSDYVITPKVFRLDPGQSYRLDIQFVSGDNTLCAYVWIDGEF